MLKLIKKIFSMKCRFLDPKCKAFNGGGLLKCSCGKTGKAPSAPAYQLPSWAQGIPTEQLDLIRSQVGKQAEAPEEFGISSQLLQGLTEFQPEQFSFPIEQIQQALEAQQGLQYRDFLKEINPIMAAQGQLDSSAYTNRISDFLQGQQAQSYGSNADLLTKQALQNLQIMQWLPQFKSGIAGQLAGLGGQRSALDQFNLQLPFQTTIPALGNVYGQGMQFGDRTTQQANMQYQQDLQSYREAEARKQQMYQQLGSLALAGATGGMSGAAGMLGPTVGAGGGALMGLQGTAGTASLLNQFPGLNMGTGNYQQRTNWTLPKSQSQILGFDTRAFS